MYRFIIVSFCLLFAASSVLAVDRCKPDRVKLRWQDGQAQFKIEIADTAETREKGLMFRKSMPRYSGMLFIYPKPQAVSFWMRNTVIPLDILFFNAMGQLEKLHKQAQPFDLTSITGGNNIQYVLELNGGMANVLGIDSAAELQHPAIEQGKAAWPCPAKQ